MSAANLFCAQQSKEVKLIVEKCESGVRDGDPSGAELVCEHVCPHRIVHRWIRDDRKLADEVGARG